MQGFALNGQVVGGTGSAAAIDTGTSLIYMPASAAQTFYQAISPSARQIDSQGHWAVPCSTSAFELFVAFGGTQYAVSLEDFVIGYSDSSEEFCVGAVIAANQNDPNGQPIAIGPSPPLASVSVG